MKSRLLAVFNFTKCTTERFTHNLRCFVIVLHDYPLKVENTMLYNIVKRWRSSQDVEEAITLQLIPLLKTQPLRKT